MERLDDDRPLARVTYLPGVTPREESVPGGAHEPPASSSSRSVSPPVLAASEAASVAASSASESAPAPQTGVTAARHVAITALARRGLSRREMERHLAQRGFEQHEIETELARLEEVGFIDDIALAQNLVGTLQERKGLGRSGIAAELTKRLLAPAAIEYALDLIDSSDEVSRARELALKWMRQHGNIDRETAMRRLSGYLTRRGYSGSTVRSATESVIVRQERSGVASR